MSKRGKVIETFHNTAQIKLQSDSLELNLDNLYDIEEAAEKIWSQITSKPEWNWNVEYKEQLVIPTNGKERLNLILQHLGMDKQNIDNI